MDVVTQGEEAMPHARDETCAAAILDRRARGLLALDEAFAELADADCAATLATLIAERLRVRADAVARALDAESDEAISVMCRAAGLRMNSYSALLRMRRRRNRGLESSPAFALTFFSDLPRVSAERLLPRIIADLLGRSFNRERAR
jgi:hypothetical protein